MIIGWSKSSETARVQRDAEISDEAHQSRARRGAAGDLSHLLLS